jgi:hypothetical protein
VFTTNTQYYGGWSDYDLIVSGPCTTTPAACSITNSASPTQCSGYSLTINGSNPNVAYTGISYQWQSAPTATGPWSNILGANALSYTTPPLGQNTYYRITDTCGNTSTGATSAAYAVPITGYPIPYVQNFDYGTPNPGLTAYNIPACMQRNGLTGQQTYFAEGFESTTFPPTTSGFGAWSISSSGNGLVWNRATSATYGAPSGHNSSAFAWAYNYAYSTGNCTMISPAIPLASAVGTSKTLSYWQYRYNSTNFGDHVQAYINTSPTLSGATLLQDIPTSCLGAPTVASAGWYQYTASVPAAMQNSTVYLIFYDVTAFWWDGCIDDVNISYLPSASMWGTAPANLYHASDGTILPNCAYAADSVGNTNGKTAYITTPMLKLTQGITYRVKFGYARGASNWQTNTGTPANSENLYVYAGTTNPGTASSVTSFPGTQIFSTVINANPPVPTTANLVTYTAPASAGYFFSWIDVTPHTPPTTTANGTVALDSIRIDSFSCVGASILTQPLATNSICQGYPISLSVTGAGYGLSYQWYYNGSPIPGATASTFTLAAAAATDAGTYTVKVSSSCGAGNSVFSSAAQLIVNPAPLAVVTPAGSTTICPGATVTLNSSTGSGYTYQWYLGGAAINGQTNPSFGAVQTGSYTVMTTANGCSATSAPIAVNVLPAPVAVAIPAGAVTVCQGNCVTINANTGSGLTYQWYVNSTPINAATAATYVACSSGSYQVLITNSNGCTTLSPVAINVTVNPLPPATVTPSGPDTFCQNQSVTLSTPVVPGVTYQWQNNGVNIPGQTSNTYIAVQTGLYTLNVTNTSTFCTATSNASTVLLNTPPANISYTTLSLCSGAGITLNANTGANLTYQWNLNGYPMPGQTNSTLNTATPGNYTVTVTQTAGTYSCSATSLAVTVTTFSPPPAYITTSTSTTFCAGNAVILNANSGTGFTYQWFLNGSAILNATGLTYSATATGNYTVKVTSSAGCYATSPATVVTVIPLPTPTIVASGPVQLCPGGSVQLSTATGPGLTYQWYNGATPISGATFPLYVTNTTASYTVQVTNNTGCQGYAPNVQVTMNPNPSATITPAGTSGICAGSTVTLSGAAGAGNTYQWMLNGNNINGATSQNLTVATGGLYKVIVTSAVGCTSTTPVADTVIVHPLPLSSIITGGPTSVCSGDSVVMQSNTGVLFQYQWKKNAVTIPGATTSNYTALSSGSYTVTIKDSNGCVNTSAPDVISVYGIPTAAFVPAADTGFCSGSSVLLTAVSGTGYSYQWLKNGVVIPGGNSQTYTANQPGAYSVRVTSNICSATSSSKNVAVYPLPVDTFIVNGAGIMCLSDSMQLSAVGSNGYTYQWLFNGAAITGATGKNYWAKTAGNYSVKVYSNYGCYTHTSDKTINTYPPPNPAIYANGVSLSTGVYVSYQWYSDNNASHTILPINGATSNGYVAPTNGSYWVKVVDHNGCSQMSDSVVVDVLSVGRNIMNNIDVKIFPNPATTIVYIECAQAVNVKVTGLEGKSVMEVNNATQLDLGNLANGVYLINVYDANDKLLKVERLLKNNQ